MNKSIVDLMVSPQATILDAIQAMERPPKDQKPAGIVLAVEGSGRLVGVVTDGDIRRAILAGVELQESIERIMTRDPIVMRQSEVEVGSYSEFLGYIRQSRRMMDPTHGKIIVVDEQKRVVDVISFSELLRLQSIRAQTICVVGMGYVGLTLAVALAQLGLSAYGVEKNNRVRTSLRAGELHFHEAGLERAFRSHLGKQLFIAEKPSKARADIYLICVGTPVDDKGQPLMQDLEAASGAVGAVLKKGDLVGLRSTVPMGTSRGTVLPILEKMSGLTGGRDFDFVFVPERTVAGDALNELPTLPQVIGSLNRSGLERATALFRELTASIISVGSLEEAEAVKLMNNAFRDHVFAFANEVALICSKWGLDTARVIRAANEGYPRDPIPQASPGVGGTCLRKDPYLLLASAQRVNYEPYLIGRSRQINEYMPKHVFENLIRFLAWKGTPPHDARIFVVGFAFKGEPETSDIRDSSTIALVELLRARVGAILGYDTVVRPQDLSTISKVKFCSIEEGFAGSDCVVIMNNHRSYLRWKIYDLLTSMRRPALFLDGWRLFEPADICKVEGITYGALGIEYVRADPSGKLARHPNPKA